MRNHPDSRIKDAECGNSHIKWLKNRACLPLRSGIASRGASRKAPYDKIFVNFKDNAEPGGCKFSAANASAVAKSNTSYACKLQAQACALWNGRDRRFSSLISLTPELDTPTCERIFFTSQNLPYEYHSSGQHPWLPGMEAQDSARL